LSDAILLWGSERDFWSETAFFRRS
jgi:hypothetical protein